MQKIKDILLSSRVKSFLWRAGMMFVSGGVIALQGGLKELDLSEFMLIVSGLFLGEVSKWLNSAKK